MISKKIIVIANKISSVNLKVSIRNKSITISFKQSKLIYYIFISVLLVLCFLLIWLLFDLIIGDGDYQKILIGLFVCSLFLSLIYYMIQRNNKVEFDFENRIIIITNQTKYLRKYFREERIVFDDVIDSFCDNSILSGKRMDLCLLGIKTKNNFKKEFFLLERKETKLIREFIKFISNSG